MVVDTSALVAILLRETGWRALAEALSTAEVRLLSAAGALEASIVMLVRKGPAGVRELDLLLHTIQVEVVPFDRDQVALARRAYEHFGKGRHPARLNFGDCCAYALARQSGEPLLFVGDDFGRTDVGVALPT